MQKQKPGLLQLGIGLFLVGVIVRVVLALSETLLAPLSMLAIVGGIVLIIVGLVSPRHR